MKNEKKEVNVILILNIGVGNLPPDQGEIVTRQISQMIKENIDAEENGIRLLTCPCPKMVGIQVQAIPLKAMLEGKYRPEDVRLPEVEKLLEVLKDIIKEKGEKMVADARDE